VYLLAQKDWLLVMHLSFWGTWGIFSHLNLSPGSV
jgi:hypothetical protein